jgi:two-component system sensor histidine kinase KdpD
MRRILDNLLGNAVKYGDTTAPIEIHLSQNELETTLEVHNEGPVIPENERLLLFEPFKRPANSHKKSGWGIGLSLVKGLVDAQRGKIFVESNDSDGTTFRVTFPNHLYQS